MAELVNNFQLGKMNKDADERLVPRGEYRDALNIEVATSEGSGMGVVQNIKGNVELTKVKSFTDWEDSVYIKALVNPVCVGSIADPRVEKIYWFIASDGISAIAEYDQLTGLIQPILVDTKGILDFSLDFYITGINILEGQLIWTDNQTEPKICLIEKWKGSTPNFITHSQSFGRDFLESDITVIRKRPLNRLNVTPYPSARYGPGTGVTPFISVDSLNFNIGEADEDGVMRYSSFKTYGEDGLIRQLDVTGPDYPTNYKVGDIVHLKAQNEGLDDEENEFPASVFLEYTIVIEITGPAPMASGEILTNALQPFLEYKLLSIPDQIPYTTTNEAGDVELLQWEGILFEENILFEDVFPRFSYRWKYDNNQYSGYAPFTNVIFIGGEFEYLSSDGHNAGMENHTRRIEITDIDWGDEWVKEVEILYKPSHSTTVYVVDEIKLDFQDTRPTTFTIDTEIVGAVVAANQLLRPYDNVPTRALAQEVGSNRIIYGNYTQQFDVVDPKVQTSLEITDHPSKYEGGEDDLRMPFESLKSMRTYQVGANYLDTYGRETPVFTTLGASKYVAIDNASKVSHIKATLLGSDQPDWATHYKYWIKETSNEYYNLALDRFYDAEDGNVWCSFPSSEVNKLREGGYIILKKEHDSDTPIIPKARFKILDIQNEAPDFVATTNFVISDATVYIDHIQSQPTGTNPPGVGKQTIQFEGPHLDDNTNFHDGFESGYYVRFEAGGSFSEDYRIDRGGPTGDTDGENSTYTVSLDRPMGNDCAFLDTIADLSTFATVGEYTMVIIQKKIERKAEFVGRFFAKINRTPEFDKHVRDVFDEDLPYGIIEEANIPMTCTNGGKGSPTGGDHSFGWNENNLINASTSNRRTGTGWDGPGKDSELVYPTAGNKYWSIMFAAFKGYDDDENYPCHPVFVRLKQGVEVRFVDDTGKESQIYKMTNTRKICGKRSKSNANNASNHFVMFGGFMDRPMESGMGPIVNLQIMKKVKYTGKLLLSSSNPAVFETEPKEAIDIDIYFQASDALPIATMNEQTVLDWFNCYSYGNGVESNRIRDDYNEYYIDKNPIANAPLEIPYQKEVKGSSLIFSQIYNNNAAHNGLNQFIQAESITKDINPIHGSIQKLSLTDTNLITLCEDKCFNILANKDAIFNADGNSQITSNNAVLGQAVAFSGEFGISKNPESFASYGFRRYFTDKARGVVLRLSKNGLTVISGQGMGDFFGDNLKHNNKLIGSYDEKKAEYNLTFESLDSEWQEKLAVGVRDRSNVLYDCEKRETKYPTLKTTISYKDEAQGWTSRKTFIQENGISLNHSYYTFKDALLYEHAINEEHNNFYGLGINTLDVGGYYESSLDVVINEMPDSIKGFKTLSYTGTTPMNYQYQVDESGRNYNISEIKEDALTPISVTTTPGWYTQHILTDLQEGDIKEFITKEGNKHYNHIKGHDTYFNSNCDTNLDSREFSVQGLGHMSKITGDVLQTEWTVKVCAFASEADRFYSEECVVLNNMSNGSLLDFLTPVKLIIKPKPGYTLEVDNLLTPGAGNNVSNITKEQEGDNVALYVTMQGAVFSDIDINVTLIGLIKPEEFTVSGYVKEQFSGNMTPTPDPSIIVDFPNIIGGPETPYSVTGQPGDVIEAFSYTMIADEGSKFVWGPILSYVNGLPSNYAITKDPTYSPSGLELLASTVTIHVTIPDYNVSGDAWNLKAIADGGWFEEENPGEEVVGPEIIIDPTDPIVIEEHRILAPTVTGLGEDLTVVLREGSSLSKSILVGREGIINGYGTIYGDLKGGTKLTLSVEGQSGELFSTPEITQFEIRSGENTFDTVSGSDPLSQATFVWSAFLNSPVTIDSQMIWNIHVGLASITTDGGDPTTEPLELGPIQP